MVSQKFLGILKGWVPNDTTDFKNKMVDEVRIYKYLTKFKKNEIIYEEGDSIDIIYDFMAEYAMEMFPGPIIEDRHKPKKNPYFSKKMRFPG